MDLKSSFSAVVEDFKVNSKLSADEAKDFSMTSLRDLEQLVSNMQKEQERKKTMRAMRRLEPFLVSMKSYGKVIDTFLNASEVLAFVWGPMKFILQEANMHIEVLNTILDAYQDIGDHIPLLEDFVLFDSHPHLRQLLVMIFTDILEFHREALRHFRKPSWNLLFAATWRGSQRKLQLVVANMKRHRDLIDRRASIMQLQQVFEIRKQLEIDLVATTQAENDRRRGIVNPWLSAFSNECEHEKHREVRSNGSHSGAWLLCHPKFQKWFSPSHKATPMLWLTGIPGAGKTVLASVVIDELSKASESTPRINLAYFYCKYGTEGRNSFVSVAKSIIAQLLRPLPDSLSYIYEEASKSSEACLSSKSTAERILDSLLVQACTGENITYLVIDGVDECDKSGRNDIPTWFHALSDRLSKTAPGSLRCMFISQDIGAGAKDWGLASRIKISRADTQRDIQDFALREHRKMEVKFGELRQPREDIAKLVTARAQGMFLFAKVMLVHLNAQLTKEDLLQELDPSTLPTEINTLYDKIMHRMEELRPDRISRKRTLEVLSWIICAPRPLRWREVQAALSIDLDDGCLKSDKRILDTPKGLLTAFIEVRENGMVEIVHESARKYLVQSRYINSQSAHLMIAIYSMAYLSWPEMEAGRDPTDIEANTCEGTFAFVDYASACWSFHLRSAISAKILEDVQESEWSVLRETLEAFITTHWAEPDKSIEVSKKTKDALFRLSDSEMYGTISHSFEWFERLLDFKRQMSGEEEALTLLNCIGLIRSALEAMRGRSRNETARLEMLYGEQWFKCPRVSCYYYHEGFRTEKQRKAHVSKHERPFLCVVDGCDHSIFGFTQESELSLHLSDYHGFPISDSQEPMYPKPTQERKAVHSGPGVGNIHRCATCSREFTRKYNLASHIRSAHTGERPYKCSHCDLTFARDAARKRHEELHREAGYFCFGTLEDGAEWGCRAKFSRKDKREDHFKSGKGRLCIMPLVEEKLRKGEGDDSVGLSSGEDVILPNFAQFLALCGISKESSEREHLELDSGENGKTRELRPE